ncbi:helix-turn-helix transcriptional regulator [Nakamurella sp. GG22]
MVPQILERAVALQQLHTAAREAVDGHGSVVAVNGEAGIGKTSLLRAFLAELPAGCQVLTGASDDLMTARPLGPLRDAAAGIGGPLEAALTAGRTEDVYGSLVTELERLAPVVLVLEDLHWADDATLDVVAYLVRRIETLPVAVILTMRNDGSAGEHPLFGLLGALAGYRVHRLPLSPLSPAAVEQLAQGSAWAGPTLHALTGGNPFYVTETLAAPRSAEVPETVAQSVVARVRRLSPRCRHALEQLSIVPRLVEFDIAENLLGDELGALDEAEERGVIEVRADGIAFRHELARRAVQVSVPRLRRRQMHGAVARALMARREPNLAAIVHHALQAGDVKAVCRYAPEAGREAAGAGSHRQALAHFESALRFADHLPPIDEAKVLVDYSWELYNAHRFAAAITACGRAVDLFASGQDRAGMGEALVRLSRYQFMQGDIDQSLTTAGRAVDVLDAAGSSAARATAATYRASLLALAGDPAEASSALLGAETLAVEAERRDLVCLCRNYESLARADLDPAGRIEVLTESLQMALDQGHHEYVARGYTNLAEMLYRYGRFDELRRCVQQGLAYTADHGFTSHAYNLEVHRALLLMRSGDLPQSEDVLRALVAGRADPGMLEVYSAPSLIRVQMRRGASGTRDVLTGAWNTARAHRFLTGLAFAGTALAEWSFLNGRPDVAGQILQQWWKHADRPTAGPVTAELLLYCRRAGLDVTEDLPPDCPIAIAAALQGDWRGAARAWAAMGDFYEMAVELGGSAQVEETLEAIGVLDRLGATAAATLLRRRLKDLGVRTVPRGPIARTRANPAGLTPRQRDVLELLSADMTNAQIATELFLSVRTVDHHVSAILTKLGVDSRGNAKSAAESLGLVVGDH